MLLSLPPPALEQPAGVATMGPPLPPDESEVRVTHEDPVEDDLPPTTDRKLLLSSRTKGSDVRRAMTGAGGGGAKDRDRDRELRPGRESLKKARTSKVDIIESHAREYSRGMNGILGEFKLDYGSEATSDDASDAELDGRDSSVSKAGDEDGPGDGAGTPAAPQIRISPNSQGAHPGSHRQSHFIHLATRAANNSSIAQNRFMTDVSYPAAAAAGARGRHRNELRALKNYKYCIILPNDCWKIRWDLCISLLIVATAIYTPYRLAYIDEESTAWVVSELGVDSFFLLDMLFSFFSAYYDATDVLVDARRTIACNYLRGWFWVDFLAVFPVGLIIDQTTQVNDLARVARLSRLYRLVKMIKLLRMMRIVKQRGKFQKYLSYIFKTSISVERLLVFLTIFLILCHVATCMWYFIAKLEDFHDQTWVLRYGYEAESPSELYLIGFYFTITTITTVGYGDMSGGTFTERIFCIGLMIVGVVSYSFAISSLTSVISSLDSKQAKLKEKLNILNNIRSEYDMDFELYWKLRQSLYYDHSKDMTDKQRLLKELPGNLKVSVSDLMYRKVVKGVKFFEDKSAHFMATIGPLLRPIIIEKGEHIFLERDPVDASRPPSPPRSPPQSTSSRRATPASSSRRSCPPTSSSRASRRAPTSATSTSSAPRTPSSASSR